jgi:hypothetical protein
MKNLKFAVVLLLSTVVLVSCEKWRDNRSPFAASDNALAESSYLDAFRAALNAAVFYEGSPSNIDTCANLSITTNGGNSYPVLITLDYGSSNCNSYFNFIRRGIIKAQVSQPISQQGSQITITFENFYSNDYLVEGSLTINNLGITDDKTRYKFKVNDGKITNADNEIVSWSGEYVLERTTGEISSDYIWDDIFSVTGSATGVNSDGNNFSTTIVEPLVLEAVCRWATKGVSKVEPNDRKTNEINYGDGNGCDNQATVTIGKKDYETTLR